MSDADRISLTSGGAPDSALETGTSSEAATATRITDGLEHSIANMFLLPMGVILKNHGGATFLTTIDISKYGDLTWGNIIWHNLVPVTLGNIVGGGLIAGLYQWYGQQAEGRARCRRR